MFIVLDASPQTAFSEGEANQHSDSRSSFPFLVAPLDRACPYNSKLFLDLGSVWTTSRPPHCLPLPSLRIPGMKQRLGDQAKSKVVKTYSMSPAVFNNAGR
ncbi:hypothetical protein PGT21_027679 [Puccinia graminis f. sp. tritici]|uniref:Uncharacterized protein n=1 Tax=Puccinia graminis f. sp. tritici TaxID=56615 RepID=A0A5B0MEG4_PUCGR|nr:hypothetical protein PGT21_027679 [Puccinia graminis f. sp. tritici]